MKNKLLAILLAVGWHIAAGQQISVTGIDSSYYNCTVPAYVDFMVYGTASGYAPGDLITVSLETGDGTVYTDVINASGQFFSHFPHTYSAHGNYTVKYKAVMPGAADSIVKVNELLFNPCDSLKGRAYHDVNGNCSYDAGENFLSGISVTLTDPGDNYPSHFTQTDANGYYSFFQATSNNLFTFDHSGSSNCGIQNSTVSIPSTIDIPINSPVGFNTISANPQTVCQGDSISIYGSIYNNGYQNDTAWITANYGDGNMVQFVLTPGQTWFGHNYTYSSPGTYTPMFTLIVGQNHDTAYTNTVTVSICGNVSGILYEDLDLDCIQDPSEPGLANQYVVATNGSSVAGSAVTDATGAYSMNLPQGVNYTVHLSPWISYYVPTCPASGSAAITSIPATADFALTCNTNVDHSTYGTSFGIVPGMPATFHVYGQQWGCALQPGTVTIDFDQTHLSIDSFSIQPSQINGNQISWNYTTSSFMATIYAKADTILQLGDTLCFPINVSPVTNDPNTYNNNFNLCRVVTSSYDPNMKEGWKGIGQNGLIKQGETLDYTIHFQNTGTSPAMNVYIRDTLPAGLDLTTLEILGASHPFNWYSWQGNHLKFEFNNINLPDSFHNEPQSHGYIIYRIKAESDLPHGSQIRNGAGIFFDYNAPVITNKTLHTIDIFLNMNEHAKNGDLSIYPNPATEEVRIKSPEEGTFLLFDLSGKKVLEQQVSKGESLIDLRDLPSGVFILQVQSESGTHTGKLIRR